MILNGNHLEHYEIATYGSLLAFAKQAVALLEQTLKKEKAADAKLTQLAETVMNAQAARHQTA